MPEPEFQLPGDEEARSDALLPAIQTLSTSGHAPADAPTRFAQDLASRRPRQDLTGETIVGALLVLIGPPMGSGTPDLGGALALGGLALLVRSAWKVWRRPAPEDAERRGLLETKTGLIGWQARSDAVGALPEWIAFALGPDGALWVDHWPGVLPPRRIDAGEGTQLRLSWTCVETLAGAPLPLATLAIRQPHAPGEVVAWSTRPGVLRDLAGVLATRLGIGVVDQLRGSSETRGPEDLRLPGLVSLPELLGAPPTPAAAEPVELTRTRLRRAALPRGPLRDAAWSAARARALAFGTLGAAPLAFLLLTMGGAGVWTGGWVAWGLVLLVVAPALGGLARSLDEEVELRVCLGPEGLTLGSDDLGEDRVPYREVVVIAEDARSVSLIHRDRVIELPACDLEQRLLRTLGLFTPGQLFGRLLEAEDGRTRRMVLPLGGRTLELVAHPRSRILLRSGQRSAQAGEVHDLAAASEGVLGELAALVGGGEVDVSPARVVLTLAAREPATSRLAPIVRCLERLLGEEGEGQAAGVLEVLAMGADAARCQLCGDLVDAGPVTRCPLCETAHHPDCWAYAGGCTVYACQGGR